MSGALLAVQCDPFRSRPILAKLAIRTLNFERTRDRRLHFCCFLFAITLRIRYEKYSEARRSSTHTTIRGQESLSKSIGRGWFYASTVRFLRDVRTSQTYPFSLILDVIRYRSHCRLFQDFYAQCLDFIDFVTAEFQFPRIHDSICTSSSTIEDLTSISCIHTSILNLDRNSTNSKRYSCLSEVRTSFEFYGDFITQPDVTLIFNMVHVLR